MLTSILRADECRVWWADPREEAIETLTAPLSAVELARATTYHHEQDRRRYLTACWLLRGAAAVQLGVDPSDVPVDRQCPDCGKAHGRPLIRTGGAPLHASISHSADRVAVALTPLGPVGVDVEEIPNVPIDELAGCALSPAERDSLRALPEPEQHSAFTRMWVCKEAVLKASGHGLRIPPDQVHVSRPGEPLALLGWPVDIPASTVGLHPLDAGRGYHAAVAVITAEPFVNVTQTTIDHQEFSLVRVAA